MSTMLKNEKQTHYGNSSHKKKLMCTIILDKANFMRRKISINVLLSEDNEVPSSQEYRMQNVKTI